MLRTKNLFLSLLLCYSLFRAADSHLVIEEKTECNLSRSSKMDLSDLPPISIVDLTRKSQKVSRKEAENKKSSKKNAKYKVSPKPRPPPAANCVPTFKTCKPQLNSCCHYCALCKCRIFQTLHQGGLEEGNEILPLADFDKRPCDSTRSSHARLAETEVVFSAMLTEEASGKKELPWHMEIILCGQSDQPEVNPHGVFVTVGPELDLRQDLVGEGVAHDEAGVAHGTAQVHQAALGQQDDVAAVAQGVAIHLWEQQCQSGVGHGSGHPCPATQHGIQQTLPSPTFHGCLEGVDGVDFSDDDSGSEAPQGLGAALAHVPVSCHHCHLPSNHDICGTLDAIDEGLSAAI
ncbi:hypothetical protein IHE44_0004764, partial [Lamprotornis superbus]